MLDLEKRENNARQSRQQNHKKNCLRLTDQVTATEFVNTVFIPGRERIVPNCVDCGKNFEQVERKVYRSKHGTRRKNRCIECWKKKANESNLIRREKWSVFKRQYIESRGDCLRCHYKDTEYVSVFVFHHRNPEEKEGHISNIMGAGFSVKNKEIFFAEAAKCDVMCRNCHAIIHEKGV